MHARKISQIADSRRHLRRDSGALTYRRAKRKARKANAKRERTFSRKRPLFLIFMFLVAQYYFLQSPLFHFNDVKIDGADSVAQAEIESKLGLAQETSFWDVTDASLRQNLMVMHRLREAQVDMSFPGQVSVKVNERKPAYFAAFLGNTKVWYSIDADGVVLEKTKTNNDHLKLLLPHPVRPGGQVRKSDLKVIRFFEDNLTGDLRKQVRAIKLGTTGEVAFRLKFGKKSIWVRLGRPEKLQYKLFLLGEMMTRLAKQKADITSIDLRYSAPVVKKATPKNSDS